MSKTQGWTCVNYNPCPEPESAHVSPCLSPVRTQILILARERMVMVSGTPSCSLSSIAVAPRSWTQNSQVHALLSKKTCGRLIRGLRSTRPPSYLVLFLHRQPPACPLCSWRPCRRREGSQTTPPTPPPSGPCRPAQVSAIHRLHTPGDQQRWMLTEADGHRDKHSSIGRKLRLLSCLWTPGGSAAPSVSL